MGPGRLVQFSKGEQMDLMFTLASLTGLRLNTYNNRAIFMCVLCMFTIQWDSSWNWCAQDVGGYFMGFRSSTVHFR